MLKNDLFSAHILAGGKGTRMFEGPSDPPKYLNLVGNDSLIMKHISQLRMNNFKNIFIHTNSKSEMVHFHLREVSDLTYIQDNGSKGTLSAILSGINFAGDNLIITYADTYHNIDLTAFMEWHIQKDSDFSAIVHPNNHPYDSDQVQLDFEGRILNLFQKDSIKPKNIGNMCMAALLIVRKDLLLDFLDNHFLSSEHAYDLVSDLMNYALLNKRKIYGYKSFEYIHDVGTPERLEKVRTDVKLNFALNRSHRPTIFLDRDGTIIKEIRYLNKPSDVKVLPGVSNLLKYCNSKGILTLLITNQPVVARGECTLEELRLIHNSLEDELGKQGVFLDGIFFCPHHPDKGFSGENLEFKIECNCRKPKIGLLQDAVNLFPCDLKNAFFIGNDERDKQAAENFSIPYIDVNDLGHLENNYEVTFAKIIEFLESSIS